MNEERIETPVASEASFARVGLLRTGRVNPVVLTASQAQFVADNHHDTSHHNHHNQHNPSEPR